MIKPTDFKGFFWERVAPVNELCQLQAFEDYMLQAYLMWEILETGQRPWEDDKWCSENKGVIWEYCNFRLPHS